MLIDPPALRLPAAEDFLVEPLSQLSAETLRFRGSAINAILRAHLLDRRGLKLDEALGQLVDLAGEVVFYDGGFAFFREDNERQMQLRLVRDVRWTLEGEKLAGAHLLNYWTAKYGRPLLLRLGQHPQVDRLLLGIGAGSVLAVPLFAGGRPQGALQLFGVDPACFATLDAQLLWVLALAAERLFPGEAAQPPAIAPRDECEERLEIELIRAERQQSAVTLLLLAIDRFQVVSGIHGGQAGEAVLSEVLSALTRRVRGLDRVLRAGNGEFAVILPDTTTAGGYCVAERLKQALEETCFSDGSSGGVRLTVSVGLAVYPADAQAARELLQTAGLALSEAQHNGRNHMVLYSELCAGASESPSTPTRPGPALSVAHSIPASAAPVPAQEPESSLPPRGSVAHIAAGEAGSSEPVEPAWFKICDFRELSPAASPLPLPAETKPAAVGVDNLGTPAWETAPAQVPMGDFPAYAETGTPARPGAAKDLPGLSAASIPASAQIPPIAGPAFTPVRAQAAPAVSPAPQLIPKPAVSGTKVYSGQRREQRMHIALPVRVWGMDVNGELFEQDAATLDITTVGARLRGIIHPLQRGCVVGVQHQASKARFRVKWVGAEGSQSQGQIGLRLLDEGKLIWGRALRRALGDDYTGLSSE